MKDHVYFSLDQLKSFMVDVFIGMGCPPDEAEICADVLNAADLRGVDSHGVGRLKPIYYDRVMKLKVQNAVTRFEVERDIAATAVVNGHNGMGMVIAKKAMDMAIAKARQFGIGMVIAKNSTHYGIAAYYPMMASSQNMIGITGTNARPSIAPTWGVENMLGTNPLVFAVPTDEPFPFTNDYANSIAQRGKIEWYAREGKELPTGWAVDIDGHSETNPDQVLADLIAGRAALTPLGGIGEEMGGHKGYGYASVVELLSAGLQLGPFMRQLSGMENGIPVPILLGHFFIAIDISHFTDVNDFKKHAGDILRDLRGSKKSQNAQRIYTHGEKEYYHSLERAQTGVPLPPIVCSQLSQIRDELGLKYRFEWDENQ